MKAKKFGTIALACVLLIGCAKVTAKAAWVPEKTVTHLEEMPCVCLDAAATDNMSNGASPYAYGSVNFNVAKKRTAVAEESFSLNAGDTVTLNCVYTPRSASIDIGLVTSDGHFYYVNSTTGTIDASIEVSKRGTYTLAVRNNSPYNVSVTGSVYY